VELLSGLLTRLSPLRFSGLVITAIAFCFFIRRFRFFYFLEDDLSTGCGGFFPFPENITIILLHFRRFFSAGL
jgi:hypothetical protein